MQNKGLIRGFALTLALICLYQLSFTFLANKVESDAKQAVESGETSSEIYYLDSVANSPVFSFIPSLTYKVCRENEINLGLDLQGGMSVVLEVSVADILTSLVGDQHDPLFKASVARAREMEKDAQEDFITLFGKAFALENQKLGGGAKLHSATYFGTQELSQKFSTLSASDEEVMKIVKTEADGAIDRAFTILRARIDKFGVAQPNVQKLQQSGRILIELPGVKDAERIKKLLKTTAQLQFWETRESAELLPFLLAANARLQETEENPNKTAEDKTVVDGTAKENSSDDESEDITSILDSESNADDSTVVENTNTDSTALANAFNPLFNVFAPNVSQQGQPSPGPLLGFAAIKDTAKVNKYLARKDIRKLLPAELRYTKFLWTVKPRIEGSNILDLIALKSNRKDEPALNGDVIIDASANFGATGSVEVSMSMNNIGAKSWKRLTANNIGKSVAIVLDDNVYSFPTVNQEIPNGSSQISGNFNIQEGKDLANILKAGKLPARTHIIQADEVGASLGQKAIDNGLASFVAALMFVLLYMFFYYSNAGLGANIALLANMFFVFGVLAGFKTVLTLPGIAGIVLTIGMAVDANVLIFERIKEELDSGKNIKNAISDGYKFAYAAIIDANVTTLLTGIILYVFGTGPIRGFAVTLIIGILTSLFCAIFITRIILEARISKGKGVNFYTGVTKGLFQNNTVSFLSKKKMAYAISGIIIVLGISSMVTRGFDQGVDFTGGRSYVVSFTNDVKTDDVRQALGKVFVVDGEEQKPIVKTFGNGNQVKLTTKFMIDQEDADSLVQATLSSGLVQIDKNYKIESSTLVGPTIADDILKAALWAVLGSLLVIFLYIIIRFGKWQYSLGAVAAVFHDVLVVLSLYSILYGFLPFSLEIDQSFIAAILTVIGYSLNDTVVVFDRIREKIGSTGKFSDKALINGALNSTLSRTMNTSLTTLIVLLVIFFMGGEVIQGFMFALLVGVVVGTYSSLFIATPVMLDTIKDENKDA